MKMKKAFTLIELLVVIAIIAVLIGLIFPAIGAAKRAAQRQESNSKVRNIIQGMIQYSTNHRGFFPGFDGFDFTTNSVEATGLSGMGQTAEARYWILLDGNYTDGEQIISPAESKASWPNLGLPASDQQKVFTSNYSYAMLKIAGSSNASASFASNVNDRFRREEWRNGQNALAPVVSDRLVYVDATTPSVGNSDTYLSIHDGNTRGNWEGSIGFGDLSVEFSDTPKVPTRFAGYDNLDNPNTPQNNDDDIFDDGDSWAANAGDLHKNAAMTYEGLYDPAGPFE